jgi:hypothetical protein
MGNGNSENIFSVTISYFLALAKMKFNGAAQIKMTSSTF